MDRSFKLFTVLVLMITSHFLGTVSSASLLGINFDAPKNIIRKGVEKIPQIIDRIHFLNEKSNEHRSIGSDKDRIHFLNDELNENTYNPTFNTNQFVPQQGPNFVNVITTVKYHNDVYYNRVPVTPKNQEYSGPPLSKNDEKYIEEEEEKHLFIAEKVNSVTEAVYEYDTDYTSTTTTDGEWTTIDDTLNRIANPAVVASILG